MAQPQVGTVVKKTTFEQVLPADDAQVEKKDRRPPLFDFLATIKPEDWSRYELYVYRSSDGGGRFSPIKEYLRTPVTEFQILRDIGGGILKFMLKQDGVLIKNEVHKWEGEPRIAEVISATSQGQSSQNGSVDASMMGQFRQMLAEVLREMKGGDAASEAVRSAISLNADVFKTGLETLRGTLVPAAPAAPANSIQDTLNLISSIKTLFVPTSVDPIKQTLEMITALKGSGLIGGGGDKTNIGLELVRQLPSAMQHISSIVDRWAGVQELHLRAQLSAQGKTLPIAAPAAVNAPRVIPMPASQPHPAPPIPIHAETQPAPAAEPAGDPVQDMIENAISNILIATQDKPVEQSVEEIMVFMDGVSPDGKLANQLAGMGESGILNLFAVRPQLRRVPQGERLQQFVKAFIARANELAAAPAAPVLTN